MTDEKLIGPVRYLQGGNRGRFPYCNSVYVEGAGILIDPGADRERLRELRDGPGVREIWLSHWHEDHFMSMDLFDDVPFVQMESEAAPLSDVELFLDWYGYEGEELRKYFRDHVMEEFHYRPRRASRYFQAGGEIIDLGTCTVEVIATPGHTPGHTAFYFREPRVLFLGDYDLTRFGPWYGDRGASIDLTIDSVNRLRAIPAVAWIGSHEDGLYEGNAEKLFDSYLAVIGERDAKIMAFLSQPRTLTEIAAQRIMYRKHREPREFYDWAERSLVAKHLERMVRDRRAVLEEGRYRLI